MARFLLAARHPWYLKFFDGALRALAARGHHIHVIFDHAEYTRNAGAPSPAIESLARDCARISFGASPRRANDRWVDLSYWTRRSQDFVRFLGPRFDSTPILRERAVARVPPPMRALGETGLLRRRWAMRAVEGILDRVDRAAFASEDLDGLFTAIQPDAVIVTPLIALGSEQFDILRAAQVRGIPTALAVASWDHLSSKALVRTPPDRIFVWNSVQRREAIEYHGIPEDRIVVTGAQCFDECFERHPSCDASTFRRRVGLPDGHPILLYVCSALFKGSPSEARLVERWIAAVRASPDPLLRCASILVRPHPKRAGEWNGITFDAFEGVSVWPPFGEAPIVESARQNYFDCLWHATAVVGLNTSAQIEGGILGRPIYTILLPEYRDNQEGTPHFRYLLDLEGGLLHAARSMCEHLDQLGEGLRDPNRAARRNRAFVGAFVRPNGLDTASTAHFVDAVEQLPAVEASEVARAHSSRLLRCALIPLARALRGTAPGTTMAQADKAERAEAARRARYESKRHAQRRRKAADVAHLESKRREKAARSRRRRRHRERTQWLERWHRRSSRWPRRLVRLAAAIGLRR